MLYFVLHYMYLGDKVNICVSGFDSRTYQEISKIFQNTIISGLLNWWLFAVDFSVKLLRSFYLTNPMKPSGYIYPIFHRKAKIRVKIFIQVAEVESLHFTV